MADNESTHTAEIACTCAGALIETNAHEVHCAIYEGVLAPRCPACGWQAVDRPYTEETLDARRAEARADVVAHKAACPGPSESPSSPGNPEDGA